MSADWIKVEPVSVIKEELEDDTFHIFADDVLHDPAAIKTEQVVVEELFPAVEKETAVNEVAGDLQHPTAIKTEHVPLQKLVKKETAVKGEGVDSQDEGEEIVLKEEFPGLLNNLVEKSEFEEENGQSTFPDRSSPDGFHRTVNLLSSSSVVYSSQSDGRESQLSGTGMLFKTTLQKNKEQLVVNGNKKTCACIKCTKTFATQCHLERHMLTQNDKRAFVWNDKRAFVCNVCLGVFTTKAYVQKHLERHSNQKSLECGVGWKGINNETTLPQKLRVRCSIRSHKCSMCSKLFSKSGILKNHMKVHSNLRTFDCKVCFKSFLTSGFLRSHSKIHTTGMPSELYKCDVCSKPFPTNYDRNVQLFSHSSEKAFARLFHPQPL